MIKVQKNDREDVCIEVGAKALLPVLRGSSQKRREHKVE